MEGERARRYLSALGPSFFPLQPAKASREMKGESGDQNKKCGGPLETGACFSGAKVFIVFPAAVQRTLPQSR